MAADETGYIDLRPDHPLSGDRDIQRLMIGRLQNLEKMGLAAPAGPGERIVGIEAERSLRDLGMRGDIIKTMHRALADQGRDRGVADFVIDVGPTPRSIVGRLMDKDLHDELTGEAYVVIDATDGRAHHVRFRSVEALEHTAAIGGIVELRRFGGAQDENPTLVLANRSDIDLQAQVAAPGATWLDYRLVEREPMAFSIGGFGREVCEVIAARMKDLAEQGLARRQGQRVILQRNLVETLRRRELEAAASKLSAETGLPYLESMAGEHVSGTYRQRLTLSSGRFAMIDNGLGFQLVPWSPSLEKQLGRNVAGASEDGGGIEPSFGRMRGLGL